jgi:anti-anti-sigma regulatory factor
LAASEEAPTTPVLALRAPPGPGTIVVAIEGRIAPADVAGLCERARALLAASDAAVLVCEVGGLTEPDAVAVEALARLQLTALRVGRRMTLHGPRRELTELLALMGLSDVFF